MYCHDILALDAIIHSASLSFSLSSSPFLFTKTHSTSCVCEHPSFKSYIYLFLWRDVRNDCPASELMEECMKRMHWQLMSTWSLHFPFTSDQVLPSCVCPIILTFHCILMWCRGPRYSPLDMAFPFNQTMCKRVGGTCYWKGNGIA